MVDYKTSFFTGTALSISGLALFENNSRIEPVRLALSLLIILLPWCTFPGLEVPVLKMISKKKEGGNAGKGGGGQGGGQWHDVLTERLKPTTKRATIGGQSPTRKKVSKEKSRERAFSRELQLRGNSKERTKGEEPPKPNQANEITGVKSNSKDKTFPPDEEASNTENLPALPRSGSKQSVVSESAAGTRR